jgi:hypothetical protein
MTNPIKDVWTRNMDLVFSEIEEAVSRCHRCCMAMDTEFPGSLYGYSHQLPKELKLLSNYELLKMNVDSTTHLIQLDLSFCEVTENGDEFSWQFTFKEFNEEDQYLPLYCSFLSTMYFKNQILFSLMNVNFFLQKSPHASMEIAVIYLFFCTLFLKFLNSVSKFSYPLF